MGFVFYKRIVSIKRTIVLFPIFEKTSEKKNMDKKRFFRDELLSFTALIFGLQNRKSKIRNNTIGGMGSKMVLQKKSIHYRESCKTSSRKCNQKHPKKRKHVLKLFVFYKFLSAFLRFNNYYCFSRYLR